MLTILLAETAVELIPPQIVNQPAVRKHALRRNKPAGKMILDSALHHSAMRSLPFSEKRGRPDIMHTFLILTLDSILNQTGKLEVLVHTVNDCLIRVEPAARIPKSYHRFIGLLEDLYERKIVPPEKPLLRLEQNCPLQKIINEYRARGVFAIVFSNAGRLVNLYDYFRKHAHEDLLVVIGGFPKGEFSTDILNQVDDCISIYENALKSWTVVSEVLTTYRLISEIRFLNP